jgi:hypothetical protein
MFLITFLILGMELQVVNKVTGFVNCVDNSKSTSQV